MKIKKRIIVYISALLAVIIYGTGCVNQSGEQQDSEGKTVVATSVTVCEILDALEIDAVIGVPHTTTYEVPLRYQEAIEVGVAMNPDMEIISSLAPAYVISPKSLESDLRPQYENSDLNACFVDLSSLEGMYESINELGIIFGREAQAAALEQTFKEYLSEYHQALTGMEIPRVLILMGLPGSYVVATNKSYVGDLVEHAGGENVYGEETEAFLNINPEDMLTQQPDIILLTSHAMPEQVEQMFVEEFARNDIWKYFEAVNNQKVYTLNHQHFGMSANLHYQEALDELKGILYEEAK